MTAIISKDSATLNASNNNSSALNDCKITIGSLPEIVLRAARDRGLTVSNGEVLYELDIGAGIGLQTWLTYQMSAIRIEVRGVANRFSPDEQLRANTKAAFETSWSEALTIEQALALVSRWADLSQTQYFGS